MTNMKRFTAHTVGRVTRASLLALLVAAVGCSDFLAAENPGAIEEPDVNDPAYATLIANGPIFALQAAWDDATYWNGQVTDEIFNREVFIEEGQIDRRDLHSDMTYINAFIYAPMQRARHAGEDAANRLKVILADSASRDLRVARALAFAGYGYIGLGEMMCVTPIDLGAPKPPGDIFADAIARFDEAIAVATAARQHVGAPTPQNQNTLAAIDSVLNLARVGAARAALNRDDKTAASTYVSQVPATFDFRLYYTDNTTAQLHRSYNRLQQGNSGHIVNTPFLAMNGDPRVPRVSLLNGAIIKPLAPMSYSSWTGTVAGGQFTANMSVRLASGLEARYIATEARGLSDEAGLRSFINERRAVGQQTPIDATVTGAALLAELRDQRSRDFYLDNHRLGDLRRYKEFYGVDLFPQGVYPGSTAGLVYNEAVSCWPLPTNELLGNPNI